MEIDPNKRDSWKEKGQKFFGNMNIVTGVVVVAVTKSISSTIVGVVQERRLGSAVGQIAKVVASGGEVVIREGGIVMRQKVVEKVGQETAHALLGGALSFFR